MNQIVEPCVALNSPWVLLASLAYCYYFLPTSTKPQAEIVELNKVNGCNDISFGEICYYYYYYY